MYHPSMLLKMKECRKVAWEITMPKYKNIVFIRREILTPNPRNLDCPVIEPIMKILKMSKNISIYNYNWF
jgi:hypothetical protein